MNQLDLARTYIKDESIKIKESQRPVFHITPDIGWMNDPNGFSWYQGDYHLFYQYYPYDVHWGPMHWGHSRTKDFIKWERLPLALAPDMPYETGCFSGSGAQMKDGRQLLMYTADLQKQQEDGTKHTIQQQCIAIGNGADYEKYEKNPVITTDKIPEGFSRADFRDPKIWQEQDGWYVVIGARREENGDGAILLYHSENGYEWEFVNILAENHLKYGDMWECPDFFHIGEKAVLIASPMNMFAEGLEFHNGHGVIYSMGSYDKASHSFLRDNTNTLEYGIDFYAPQTLETPDGRRIMIGWMQSWDNYMTPEGYLWSGMMTTPRELNIRNGRLCQLPVRELEAYRSNPVKKDGVALKAAERLKLKGVNGRVIDLDITIEGEGYRQVVIHLAEDDRYHTDLIYDREAKTLTFDRRKSGLKKDIIDRRSMYVEEQEEKIRLRILMDLYSIELFVNNGEQAMTNLIYTPLDAAGISFESDGAAILNVEKYDIVV